MVRDMILQMISDEKAPEEEKAYGGAEEAHVVTSREALIISHQEWPERRYR